MYLLVRNGLLCFVLVFAYFTFFLPAQSFSFSLSMEEINLRDAQEREQFFQIMEQLDVFDDDWHAGMKAAARDSDEETVRQWIIATYDNKPEWREEILRALNQADNPLMKAWLKTQVHQLEGDDQLQWVALQSYLSGLYVKPEYADELLALYETLRGKYPYAVLEALPPAPSTHVYFLDLLHSHDKALASLAIERLTTWRYMKPEVVDQILSVFSLRSSGDEELKDGVVFSLRKELKDDQAAQAVRYLNRRLSEQGAKEPYEGWYMGVIAALTDLDAVDAIQNWQKKYRRNDIFQLAYTYYMDLGYFNLTSVGPDAPTPGTGSTQDPLPPGIEQECPRDPNFDEENGVYPQGGWWKINLLMHDRTWLPRSSGLDDVPGNHLTGVLYIGQYYPPEKGSTGGGTRNPINANMELRNVTRWKGNASNVGENTKQDLEFVIDHLQKVFDIQTRPPTGINFNCWKEGFRDPETGRLLKIELKEPLKDEEERYCAYAVASYDMAGAAKLVANAIDMAEVEIEEIPIDTDDEYDTGEPPSGLPDAWEDLKEAVTYNGAQKRIVGLDACKAATVGGVSDPQSDNEADYLPNWVGGAGEPQHTKGDGTTEFFNYRGLVHTKSPIKEITPNGSTETEPVAQPQRITDFTTIEITRPYFHGTKKDGVNDQTPKSNWASARVAMQQSLSKNLGFHPIAIMTNHTDPKVDGVSRGDRRYRITNLIGPINFNNDETTPDRNKQAGIRLDEKNPLLSGFEKYMAWVDTCKAPQEVGPVAINDFYKKSNGYISQALGIPLRYNAEVFPKEINMLSNHVSPPNGNPDSFSQAVMTHELTHKLGSKDHPHHILSFGGDVNSIHQFVRQEVNNPDFQKYYRITDPEITNVTGVNTYAVFGISEVLKPLMIEGGHYYLSNGGIIRNLSGQPVVANSNVIGLAYYIPDQYQAADDQRIYKLSIIGADAPWGGTITVESSSAELSLDGIAGKYSEGAPSRLRPENIKEDSSVYPQFNVKGLGCLEQTGLNAR